MLENVDVISKFNGQHDWKRSCDCFNIDAGISTLTSYNFCISTSILKFEMAISSRIETAKRATQISLEQPQKLCAESVVPKHKTAFLICFFFFYLSRYIRSHTLTPRHDRCNVGCVENVGYVRESKYR